MSEQVSFKKRLFADALIIILSVLLALFLNEWRSNIKENRKTNEILENIKLEIDDNHKLADELQEYHTQVLVNIRNLKKQGQLADSLFYEGRFQYLKFAPEGVIQEDFSDIAWEVAKQEKISNRIKFLESKLLSIIYSQQQTVNGTIDRIVNLLGEREIHRAELIEESMIVLEDEFGELIGQERHLMSLYKMALKEL